MTTPSPPSAPSGGSGRPARRRRATFRPRFTVMLLWLAFFTALYGTLLAAPALIDAYRSLPPAETRELSEEERALATETAREALSGGRLRWALAAAVVTVGLGAWTRRLPGLS